MPAIVVCMPMRDRMTPETAQALRDNMDGCEITLLTEVGKPVRDARNALAQRVNELNMPADTPVLWIDDDAWWPSGTVRALAHRLSPNAVLFGLHTVRFPWSQPTGMRVDQLAWSDNMELRQGGFWTCRGPLRDEGKIVPVLVSSTHFFVHSARLLNDWEAPFTVHPAIKQKLHGVFENVVDELTDDASFSLNMLDAGVTLQVDTTVPIAHIEAANGAAFLPLREALKVDDNRLVPLPGPVEPGNNRTYGLQAYDGERSREEILSFLARTSALFTLEAKNLGLIAK